ncbi:MAG: galactokinase [Anaerolineales bacterium]|nr:galactokinase [Anaerolineales bacterium]
MLQDSLIEKFSEYYGSDPKFVVRAPGRVNIIGEHTDYNDGFVLPMAINRAIWIALKPRQDRLVKLYSLDFDQEASFDFNQLVKVDASWIEYIKGVAWVLEQAGYVLSGWEGVLAGDIPIGAGLSSSAALELATACAFSAAGKWSWEPLAMAKLGKKVENIWMGVNSGIMDQLISAAGKAGHALLIDCRSLDIKPVPLPSRCSIVVMDTMTRRSLIDSEYNTRRRQCQAAADFFGVPALRDVTLERYEAVAGQLEPLVRMRARHVITENERTLQACEAMQHRNADRLGKLMYASHVSLRDDFDICNQELNIMVEIACKQEGCYGARMTGGGFGGCAIALVSSNRVETFEKKVFKVYLAETGLAPKLYVCSATNGAEIING